MIMTDLNIIEYINKDSTTSDSNNLTSTNYDSTSNLTLDLGSGNGRYAIPLAKLGLNVIAIDKDAKLVEQCIARSISEGVNKNLNCKTLDIKDYFLNKEYAKEFYSNKYSNIIAMNILHFIPLQDFEKIIVKMQESTIIGGVHIIQTFTKKGELKNDNLHTHFFDMLELQSYYTDWEIVLQEFETVDCYEKHSDGRPKRHEVVRFVAKKKFENN